MFNNDLEISGNKITFLDEFNASVSVELELATNSAESDLRVEIESYAFHSSDQDSYQTTYNSDEEALTHYRRGVIQALDESGLEVASVVLRFDSYEIDWVCDHESMV